jgi:hypothetical protein
MATVRHLGLLPFCFSFSEVPEIIATFGVSTPYPIGLDVKTLLRWYWLVKRWTVSATVSGLEFGGDPATDSIETTFFNGNTLAPELLVESQLVCRRSTQFFAENETNAFFIKLFDDVQKQEDDDVVKQEDLYFPYLSMAFSGLAGGIGTSFVEGGDFFAGGSILIDGITLPSYLNNISGSTVSDGSITITPSEYWPYDPRDGKGPIYDSVTGAQLRGFPS